MSTRNSITVLLALLLCLFAFAETSLAATKVARVTPEGKVIQVTGGTITYLDSLYANSPFYDLDVVTSSPDIKNNTQGGSGLLLTAGTSALLIEDIVLNTDAIGVAGPTNLEFTTDNARGLTGVDGPFCVIAVSGLGANKTIVGTVDGSTKEFPFILEAGKKLYVHGSDAAGTGAGTVTILLKCRRLNPTNTGLTD